MSGDARPRPAVPGPPPTSAAADAETEGRLMEALNDLEQRPATDLAGTARAGEELHDRLRDRLRDLGSS